MAEFSPLGLDSANAAVNPPLPHAPRHYLLWHNNVSRMHPFKAGIGLRKPTGPFQQPGESGVHFVTRMRARAQAAMANESEAQRARRLRREQVAASGDLPPPWVPVHVWLKASDLDHICKKSFALDSIGSIGISHLYHKHL